MLYLSQRIGADGDRDMAALTRTLVARALARGGTFYLPFRSAAPAAQVAQAYPGLDAFFALSEGRPREALPRRLYDRYARR